jgi:carbamoylphosphate synthase small subunit
MEKLEVAIIPVDHEMAIKKRWGNIPLGSLEAALIEITTENDGFVLRADMPLSPKAKERHVVETDLYFEFEV